MTMNANLVDMIVTRTPYVSIRRDLISVIVTKDITAMDSVVMVRF